MQKESIIITATVDDITIKHLAQSGNQADVTIPYSPSTGCEGIKIVWDDTPSLEDMQEFNEKAWPKQIVPVVLRRLEQQTGKPHRAVTIAPGLCAFIPNESGKQKGDSKCCQ